MQNILNNSKKKLKQKIISSFNIDIESNYSEKAKLLWFSIINKVYSNLNSKEIFTISLSYLKKSIDYKSKNNILFKKYLKELNNNNIEFKINNRTGNEWELTNLISNCRIKDGTNSLEFTISPFLKEKLCNPETYLKLNLLISKSFKSKNTLNIYRLILDNMYISGFHTIKSFTIKEIRDYLGLNETKYIKPSELLKHIIKKSEKEINENTDLDLKIYTIRTNTGKITGFQLDSKIKAECVQYYKIPKLKENRNNITHTEDLIINDKELISFFSNYNISFRNKSIQKRLVEINSTIGKENIEEFLTYLMNFVLKEIKSGSVKRIAGFYINQLKDELHIQKFIVQKEKSEIIKKELELKKEVLLEKELKANYETYIINNFKDYVIKNINKLENDVINILKDITNKDSLLTNLIVKNNNGIIDKDFIINSKQTIQYMIFSELIHFKNELGYKSINFDKWKDKTVNLEYLKALNQKIESGF